MSLVSQSRVDLDQPNLPWFISQQSRPDDASVNNIDVTSMLEQAFANDAHLTPIKAFDLPPQEKQLVIDTRGIVWFGERLGRAYLATQ